MRFTFGVAFSSVVLAALGLVTVPAAVADSVQPCSTTGVGGDWPSYTHDLSNTRNQPDEHTISPLNVGALRKSWSFSPVENGQHASLNSTATEDGGCVFVGTSAGFIYALDANTGRQVWKQQLPVRTMGVGGDIVGATVVDGGRVYAIINEQADGSGNGSGPYTVALDEHTGSLIWRSAAIDTRAGYYSNASPVIANGLLLAGWSSTESDPNGQGGVAVINTSDGSLATKVYTVPLDRQAQGKAGGGIWTAPAVDSQGFAYYGTGNPGNKDQQDPNTDAIVKLDLRKSSSTFGQIVGVYPGNIDTYTAALQTLQNTQLCKQTAALFSGSIIDDPLCGQLDLDFGAPPNLFTINGRQVVGDLQKAGVYHVAYTDTMSEAWARPVGTPCAFCNGDATAIANGRIFGEGTLGGTAFSLSQKSGAYNWLTFVGDGIHYQSYSVANNVVYTVDNYGFLVAFDATTGALLARRPMIADSGQAVLVAIGSAGVSIARNHVFATLGSLVESGVPVPTNGTLVAYSAPF